MKSIAILLAFCLSATILAAQEKTDTIRVTPKSKEEGNRNVMLNAASANGPREISVGLPSGDVNVLENGLPVVYTSNPHNVNTHWRGDSSLGHVGLLKFSETAITTGFVGYAVNSSTQLGSDKFKGIINYGTNHFGKQQFDANISGGMGHGWYFSGSVYQNFDPGTFKLRFASDQDRTQIYKAALTRKYHQGRGQFSVIYHYSNSYWPSNAATYAPFIYVGDGSVKEIPGFKLGTSSYLPTTGEMLYRDMRSGELKKTNLNDASLSKGNQISLLHSYTWDSGLNWKLNAKYDHSQGSYVYQTPLEMKKKVLTDGYYQRSTDGTLTSYEGYVQNRLSCLNRGKIDEFLLTSELSRTLRKSTWRVGLNEWYYKADYTSNSTLYDHSVQEYPERLYRKDVNGNYYMYYDFNKTASEYYKGYENKLALYATHDWDITEKLNIYYGARFEYQRISGENAAVYDKAGKAVGRFADYYLGTTSATGIKITPQSFDYNWLNMAFTAAANYKLTKEFGLTADFTYNTQHPALTNFASAELPNVGKIAIPLARGGVYYNNDWLTLTSLVSYIAKTNNNSTLNLINPNDGQAETTSLSYDIKTIGWTTDAVIRPFKGFDFHFLFTYQNPTYKKYEANVTFKDGNVGEIHATGNVVAEIPKVLIELDPAYQITKNFRIWTSFRYFGKTYANIKNAYYFNGRWETFGGVNWTVNKHLALGATVINFLNQTGAKGSISGAELVDKKDANSYNGHWMAGSYIRPFTVELSASVRF